MVRRQGENITVQIRLRCSPFSSLARVIAVETTGSDTLYHSVLLTESPAHIIPSVAEVVVDEKRGIKLVTKAPTSRATSLGAKISAAGVVEMACARRRRDKGLLTCVNIPDEIAMIGCLEFAGLWK